MRKFAVGAVVAALSVSGLCLASTGAASAAATAKPFAAHVTWIAQNAQTDLAETSLGTLVAPKSTNADTLSLAKITKSQHKTALAKLITIAKGLHVTLPKSPSAPQLKEEARLKLSGLAFNKTYDQDQIRRSRPEHQPGQGRDRPGQRFPGGWLCQVLPADRQGAPEDGAEAEDRTRPLRPGR